MSSTTDALKPTGASIQDDVENPEILPFRSEVFDTSTEKQRFILLSSRDAVLRDETSLRGIARLSDTTRQYVKTALTKYIHRRDLPAACAIATRCTPTKTYDDLTRVQQRIINETIINQDQTRGEIADLIGCSKSHIGNTQRWYSDLIKERTPDSIDTPDVTSDIPLDIRRDVRNETPVIPDSVTNPLLEPFDHDLLMSISPKKRFILLAGREWVLRDQPFIKAIARTTGTSRTLVETTIAPYKDKEDEYPVAGSVANIFFEDLTYKSLSPTRRQIVNELIINPEADLNAIADTVDCSYNYAWKTRKICSSIIDSKRAVTY